MKAYQLQRLDNSAVYTGELDPEYIKQSTYNEIPVNNGVLTIDNNNDNELIRKFISIYSPKYNKEDVYQVIDGEFKEFIDSENTLSTTLEDVTNQLDSLQQEKAELLAKELIDADTINNLLDRIRLLEAQIEILSSTGTSASEEDSTQDTTDTGGGKVNSSGQVLPSGGGKVIPTPGTGGGKALPTSGSGGGKA